MQLNATISWNRRVSDTCYRMGLSCPNGIVPPRPGQFVMVQVGPPPIPLLRRPFSVFGILGDPDQPEGIEILYKVVGLGTERLRQAKAGQTISMIGPLGRGFNVDPDHNTFYLAAGGIGVAPIYFLACYLRHLGFSPANQQVFLGGQTREDLLCIDAFEALGLTVTRTTDDGSAGRQCLITDPLEIAIEKDPPQMVYACGPPGMLHCVAGIVQRHQVRCQVSIETIMACGLGACLGCAVESKTQKSRYLHACLDGPVFYSDQVVF